MISLRVAGPSSTISLNSIVDVGIVDDIVDEIVTCGRALNGEVTSSIQIWNLQGSFV